MNTETIRGEIEEIIRMVGKPDDATEQFSIEAFLLEMNSLKFIELVTEIENKYQITMSSDDMLLFKGGKLSSIVQAVESQLKS